MAYLIYEEEKPETEKKETEKETEKERAKTPEETVSTPVRTATGAEAPVAVPAIGDSTTSDLDEQGL